MNTNKKSWWYTSSIGCSHNIENELEQYKYQKSFEKIKSSFTESTNSLSLTTEINQIQSQLVGLPLNRTLSKKNSIIENFIRSNCLLPFYTIEIIHSGFLIFFSVSF